MSLITPQALGLPYERWRPHQWEAIEQTVETTARVVAIQAPTGSGKTGIAGAVAVLSEGRAAISTATRQLTAQYLTDVPDLTLVQGAGNYECLAARTTFRSYFPGRQMVGCDEAPCRVGVECGLKASGCLYFDAVREAQRNTPVLTNYAYWMTAHRHGEGLQGFWTWSVNPRTRVRVRVWEHRPFSTLILDEAHDAADQVAQQMTLTLSSLDVGRWPAEPTTAHWREWGQEKLVEVKARAEKERMLRRQLHFKKVLGDLDVIAKLPDDWVWERDEMASGTRMRFAPVIVGPLVEKALLLGIAKVVLMSATLTEGTVASLGLGGNAVEFIRIPSTFPVDRRRITIYKDTSLPLRNDARMGEDIAGEILYKLDEFLDARRDRQGIIPTVSYARQQWLAVNSRHRERMVAPSSADTANAVARFQQFPTNKILVSPAIGEGVNFPYRQCEFIVIVKVPFPDVRSPLMQARVERDPAYRDLVTAQALEQAVGRGMRFPDDGCEVLILDDHARWFVFKHRALFSRAFMDAVRVRETLPAPARRVKQVKRLSQE